MSQEIKVTFIDNNDWKLPFNFAVGLHLLLIVSAIYMPQILEKKPLFPDIYTIDLINLSEQPLEQVPVKHPAPPPPKPEQKIIEEPKIIKKEAIQISEKAPQPDIKPVEIKPVSIKPLKRKIIKKRKETSVVQPKKNLEQLHKKHLNEVKEAERIAEEAARIAASEAVNQLKQMLQESNTYDTSRQSTPAKPVAPPRTRTNSNVIESQYFASIINRLQLFWSLPEYKILDPALIATIVIQVDRNGNIIKQFFEKTSGDRLFDQFVLKTLQEGAPLPVIPEALQKDRVEIGLRFRPGSIQ